MLQEKKSLTLYFNSIDRNFQPLEIIWKAIGGNFHNIISPEFSQHGWNM